MINFHRCTGFFKMEIVLHPFLGVVLKWKSKYLVFDRFRRVLTYFLSILTLFDDLNTDTLKKNSVNSLPNNQR